MKGRMKEEKSERRKKGKNRMGKGKGNKIVEDKKICGMKGEEGEG